MTRDELKKVAESLIETTTIAGKKSIEIYQAGLKKIIKPDNSPVTNGDLEVNRILTEKIKTLTPNIPIVSEETVDLNKKNKYKTFWLIDPIDGTKEYIAGKDEYTLNAALVINTVPVIGLVENMSWCLIDNNKHYIFGRDGGKNLSASEDISLLAEIPLNQSIREAADIGRPAALQETELGDVFMQLSQQVIDSVNSRNKDLPKTKKVEITHNRGCN